MTAYEPADDLPEGSENNLGLLLVELAKIDAAAERTQASIRMVQECVDAGVSCVRAAQTLIQEHSAWRASVNRESAKSKLGADSVSQIVIVIAAADEQVIRLQESYAQCAQPLQVSVETQATHLAGLEGRRQALLQRLPGNLATRHKLLRDGHRHPYICGVVDGRCDGCNLKLPTLLAQQLGRGGSASCPSCRRILCSEVARQG